MKKYILAFVALLFCVLAGCAGSEERNTYQGLCRKAGMSGEVLEAAMKTFDEADEILRQNYIKDLKAIIEKEAEELAEDSDE